MNFDCLSLWSPWEPSLASLPSLGEDAHSAHCSTSQTPTSHLVINLHQLVLGGVSGRSLVIPGIHGGFGLSRVVREATFKFMRWRPQGVPGDFFDKFHVWSQWQLTIWLGRALATPIRPSGGDGAVNLRKQSTCFKRLVRNKISTSWGRCQMPSEVLHGLQRRSSSCELSSPPLSLSIVELITWADSRASCNNQRNRVLFPAVRLLYYKTKSNRIQSVRPPTFSFWVRCGSTSICDGIFRCASLLIFVFNCYSPESTSENELVQYIVKCQILMSNVRCQMSKVKC